MVICYLLVANGAQRHKQFAVKQRDWHNPKEFMVYVVPVARIMLNTIDRIAAVIRGSIGKRLTYKELTQ